MTTPEYKILCHPDYTGTLAIGSEGLYHRSPPKGIDAENIHLLMAEMYDFISRQCAVNPPKENFLVLPKGIKL